MANPTVLVTLNPVLIEKVEKKADSLGLKTATYIRSLVIEDVKSYSLKERKK